MRTPIKRVFIDVETTGTDFEKHAIHQISGQIEIDNQIVEEFDYNVKPFKDAEIDKEALEVCGVTEEILMGYPDSKAVYNDLQRRLSKHVNRFNKLDKFTFVGYNAHFDKGFMFKFWERHEDKYFFSLFWGSHIDVMSMAMERLESARDELENFKLATVCAHMGIEVDASKLHDSQYDIHLTRELFKICKVEDLIVVKPKSEELKTPETKKPSSISSTPVSDFLKSNVDETLSAKPDFVNPNNKPLRKLRKINDTTFIIRFGKHNGSSIEEILNVDPGYIIWLNDSVDDIIVNPEIVTRAIQNKNKQPAREFNKGYRGDSGYGFDGGFGGNDDLPF